MKNLPITNTFLTTQIDDEDADLILNHTENLFILEDYVVLNSKILKRTIALHRLLLKAENNNLDVDHIDNNPLNNQKLNLRLCTRSQNVARILVNKTNHSSKFRGVCWSKQRGQWGVYVTKNRKSNFGGYFSNEIEAAKKADELLKQCHGEFAVLNFPLVKDKVGKVIKSPSYEPANLQPIINQL